MVRELTTEQQRLLQQCLADVAGCRPPAQIDLVRPLPDTAHIMQMVRADNDAVRIRADSITRSGPFGWRLPA